jgi:hypothetical protein
MPPRVIAMSIWRTGEDEDGTRHYWGAPGLGMTSVEFSLSRQQRRRNGAAVAVALYGPLLLAGAGAWLGHAIGGDLRGTVIGARTGYASAIFALFVLLQLIAVGKSIRNHRSSTKKPFEPQE